MANRTIGTPIVVGYLGVVWGAVALGLVWLTSNTAPGQPELAWEKGITEADTTTKLGVEIAAESVDADGDPVEYFFAWTVDGEASENVSRTVTNRETRKGQTFEVSVTPDDGTFESWGCSLPWRECAHGEESVARLSITIGNAPPKARVAFVDAEGEPVEVIGRGDSVMLDLKCSDPDLRDEKLDLAAAIKAGEVEPPPEPEEGEEVEEEEDPCTYKVAWFKNLEEELPEEIDFEAAELTGPELSGRETRDRGAKFTVVVVANDGEDDGPVQQETIYVEE